LCCNVVQPNLLRHGNQDHLTLNGAVDLVGGGDDGGNTDSQCIELSLGGEVRSGMALQSHGIAGDVDLQLVVAADLDQLANGTGHGTVGNNIGGLHSIGDAVASQSGGSASDPGPGDVGASDVNQQLVASGHVQLGGIDDHIDLAVVQLDQIAHGRVGAVQSSVAGLQIRILVQTAGDVSRQLSTGQLTGDLACSQSSNGSTSLQLSDVVADGVGSTSITNGILNSTQTVSQRGAVALTDSSLQVGDIVDQAGAGVTNDSLQGAHIGSGCEVVGSMATNSRRIAGDGSGQLALSVQDQDLASVASIGLGNLLVGLHSISDAVASQSGGSALHAGPGHGGSGASGVDSQTLHVVASAQLGVIGDKVHGAGVVDTNGITVLHLLRGKGSESTLVRNHVHTLQSAVGNHGQGQSTGLDLTSVDVLQTGLQVSDVLEIGRAHV